MTDRERFEAWAVHLMLDRKESGYESHYTNHAWKAWQAGRKQLIYEMRLMVANPEGEQG